MQFSPEQYEASKKHLLDFAALNIKQIRYKVNRGVYANIPTTEGSIRFKANDIFTFHFKNDKIISFIYDEKKYEPIWTQCKLTEWLSAKLSVVKPPSFTGS